MTHAADRITWGLSARSPNHARPPGTVVTLVCTCSGRRHARGV